LQRSAAAESFESLSNIVSPGRVSLVGGCDLSLDGRTLAILEPPMLFQDLKKVLLPERHDFGCPFIVL
jgi:hypothetical protein